MVANRQEDDKIKMQGLIDYRNNNLTNMATPFDAVELVPLNSAPPEKDSSKPGNHGNKSSTKS